MDDSALDRLVRAAQAERAGDAAPHPEPDELLRYEAGQMTPVEAERLQDHLVACVECARLVADLDAFPRLDPPSAADVPDAEDVEAGWERVAQALEPVVAAPAPAQGDTTPTVAVREDRNLGQDRGTRVAGATGGGFRRRQPTWPAAAVLALAAGGLGFVGSRWLYRPAISAAADEHLRPDDDTTRSSVSEAKRLRFDAARTVLQLVNNGTLHGRCEVEVLPLDRAKPKAVHRHTEQLESASDTILLDVPRGVLTPGNYRARVICSQRLAEYTFSVSSD